MKSKVKRWLEEGIVDLFLGYKMVMGHPLPYSFNKANLDAVDDLIDGPARYSLEKVATHIAAVDPEIKIGMLARDCNQRALNVLYIWNQLKEDNIKAVNVNCCPSNLKAHGDCSYLAPEKPAPLKQQVGVDNTMCLEDFEEIEQPERLSRWMNEFQKCIKCYGCRNICPVCFLQGVQPGAWRFDPQRAPCHRRCRYSTWFGPHTWPGAASTAGCARMPVRWTFPLRLLYRKVNDIVKTVFDYETGSGADQSPLSILGDKVTLEPQPMQADYPVV